MSLANPIYLWSLLGLTIPIAIHLLSRKEGRIIRLGSIRHVQETSTQQFKGIRLNEILLLALRCALIAIIALGLSGFYFNQKKGKWVLLEPGVEKNKNGQAAIDSLEKQGYESHWLSNSFPTIDNRPDSLISNYWFALRQLEKQNLEDAIVLSFTKVSKFKGPQQTIPSNIKIIPIEPEEKSFVLEAVQAGDSIAVRMGGSNSASTTFQSMKVKSLDDSVLIATPRTTKILIVSDKAHTKENLILQAAIRAIDEITPHTFTVSEKDPSQFASTDTFDWLFWINDEKTPVTNVNVLKWDPGLTNNLIVQSNKKEWMLTQSLNEEIALDSKLTLSLANMLTSNSTLQKIASNNDQRVLPEATALTSGNRKSSGETIAPTFSQFLLGLFSMLFLIERYLSFRKNQ